MPRTVFGLPWEKRAETWGHARAFAGGEAGVDGSLRRGLKLTADARLHANAAAQAQHFVFAGVKAGAEAGAQLTLQAAVPLDLFTAFGAVVRAEASAHAWAWVRAEPGLTAEQLADQLRSRLDGPWQALALALLREVEIGVSYGARAAFSAEAYARLIFAGSVIPTVFGDAGFNIVVDAGKGLGPGAGKTFGAFLRISDAQRLFAAMAAVIERTLLAEIERAAASDPVLRSATPLVRLMLPLSLSVAVELGTALTVDEPEGREAAVHRAAEAFARATTEALVAAITEWAIERGMDLAGTLLPPLSALSPEESSRARAAAGTLSAWIQAAPSLTGHGAVATPLREILAALSGLADVARGRGIDAGGLPDVLTAGWCAAALAGLAEGAAFPQPPRDMAVRIRASAGDASPLTSADAIAYLLARLGEISRTASAVAPIASILGSIDPALQMAAFEAGLGLSKLDSRRDMLTALATAMAPLVETVMLPAVDAARRRADTATSEFLGETALPALRVLAWLLRDFPAIRSASGDAAQAARERLSLGLIGVAGRSVVSIFDVLWQFALGEGSRISRDLAAVVRRGGRDDVMHRVLQLWPAWAPPVTLPDADFVADLLTLSAEIAEYWNAEVRPAQTHHLRRLIADVAAVADPAVATILDNPRAVAGEATLRSLGGVTMEAVASLFTRFTLRLLEILRAHTLRQGGSVVAVVRDGIEAAKKALDDVLRHAADLRALAEHLAGEVRRAIERIERSVGELGAVVQRGIDGAKADAREWIWAHAIEPALERNPVFVAAVPFQPRIRSGVRAAYDALADTLTPDIAGPLALLQNAGASIRALLMDQIDRSSVDLQRLRDAFRAKLLDVQGTTFRIALRTSVRIGRLVFTIDLGELSVGIGSIAGVVANRGLAIAEPFLDGFTSLASAVVDATHRRTVALEQAAAAAPITPQDAAALVTGRRPVVTIRPGERAGGAVVIVVEVQNVNDSFFTPVANLPRRVEVFVDGEPFDVPRDAWVARGAAFRLRLKVTSSRTNLVAAARFVGKPVLLAKEPPPSRSGDGAVHVGTTDGASGHLFESIEDRHASAIPASIRLAIAPGQDFVLVPKAVHELMSVHQTAKLAWREALEPASPTVPLDLSPERHILTVTAADGNGRSAAESCIVVPQLEA